MEAAIASAIYQNLEPGAIVGPVFANEAGHLIKVVDTRPIDQTRVRASHILINANDGEEAARERARALLDTLQQGGAEFTDLARRASDGPSASRGGDLGWFGPEGMAEPFYNAAVDAPVGEVVGPVKTRFGYHLIKVSARADEAVRYADLAFSLRPSPSTLTDFQNRLADVAYYAEDSGDFAAEAQNQGYDVRTTEVEEGTPSIPGIGASRQLTSFIETADEGAIGDVVELDDKFVVARIESVTPEGYRPFDEVKAEIRPRVQIEKKKDIVVRRMNQALRDNSFEALPGALGTRMRTNPEITMTTTNVAGLGQDPTFAGVAFGLDEGETSKVMEGANAAYVVRVTARNEAGELSETERNQIRERLVAQQQRQVASQWLSALREKADITDNRSAFNQ
jgi:peptidylprolyl isomerase/peptidyl-prolyl cis-trans isomerase D